MVEGKLSTSSKNRLSAVFHLEFRMDGAVMAEETEKVRVDVCWVSNPLLITKISVLQSSLFK